MPGPKESTAVRRAINHWKCGKKMAHYGRLHKFQSTVSQGALENCVNWNGWPTVMISLVRTIVQLEVISGMFKLFKLPAQQVQAN